MMFASQLQDNGTTPAKSLVISSQQKIVKLEWNVFYNYEKFCFKLYYKKYCKQYTSHSEIN